MTTPRRRTRGAWSVSLLSLLDTLCRYLLLSMLWTASLLLIVTAPGGTRAMLETLHALREVDDLSAARTFVAEFRRNAVRAGLETLPLLAVGVVLAINFAVVAHMGDQRTIVFPALLAIAIPLVLVAANLQPALTGHRERSVREGYAVAFRDIVRSPAAAAVVAVIVLAAAMLVYIQPLLILAVAAPVARGVLAARARLVNPVKENA